jgi:HlyD family secretion protein
VEEQTREQLEIARLNEAAARELVAFLNNGPTTGQQAAANGAVALAAANRNLAQAQLDALLAGATPEEIEQAAVRVAQAELGVMAAETAVAQAEAAVAQAEAGLQAAQAARDAAQVAVQRTTLRATMAGTVAQLDLNVGELVTPGTPVVTLADFSGWQVETTDLSELDVPQVQEGSTVQVTFEALPDADVRGVVQQIALMANRAPGDVVYEVTIQLSDTADLPLRWGMTAGVAFGD